MWQVVQQARDTVVTDTKLETAVVGEDILLTPRSPDAQPDPHSDALLAAGDNAASQCMHTHTHAVRCQMHVCLGLHRLDLRTALGCECVTVFHIRSQNLLCNVNYSRQLSHVCYVVRLRGSDAVLAQLQSSILYCKHGAGHALNPIQILRLHLDLQHLSFSSTSTSSNRILKL